MVSYEMNEKWAIALRQRGGIPASLARDALVKEQIEKERAALDAKTAKLKALRLAREANVKAAAPMRQQHGAGRPSR
jgi:hypothetical protein